MNSRFKYIVCTFILASLFLSARSATAAELQLAGIRLGRQASTILQKYGNPAEIRIGSSTTSTAVPGGAGAATMPGGMPTMPGMPMMPGGAGAMASTMPGMATMPTMPGMPMMPGGAGAMASTMPGMATMPTMPGMAGGMPTMPGMTGAAGGTKTTTISEVTWVYKFSKNRTLEFIINSQGRILQISTFGSAWPGIATSKGIRIGSTYKDIIAKYGWPGSHDNQGTSLIVKYPDTHRVLFTLVEQSIVGITIALMD